MKKKSSFIWGIALLRILAMILITNSHYNKIYPIQAFAFGGLLGNVIFFAVSGYCLANISESFPVWYGKRLRRIYPQTIIMTVFSVCTGFLPFYPHSLRYWVKYFIYPTYYHFIGAIVFCYVIYYFIAKINAFGINNTYVLLALLLLHLVVYSVCFNKSQYTIDLVEDNQFEFIRFIYIISMCIGIWFKENRDRIHPNKYLLAIGTLVSAVMYFGSKVYFSRTQKMLDFQILNQYTLLILLVFLMLVFLCNGAVERFCEKLPERAKSAIRYISGLTLEVYLVQFFVLRRIVDPLSVHFVIKFILAAVLIFAGAMLLRLITQSILKTSDKVIERIKTKQ